MSSSKVIRLEGRVRDLVASGDAVVETARGVVFARGGLIGERLRLGLEPGGGRVLRGRVLEVLEPSAARVAPPCAYAARCGGCALMHASLEEQRALKRRFLRAALAKLGAGALALPMTESERTLGYRRRARLAFQRAHGQVQLGFRRERSHQLVDIEVCVVLAEPLARALALFRARALPLLAGEGELVFSLGAPARPEHGPRSEAAALAIRSAGPQPPALYAACEALAREPGISGLALFAAGASKPALFGDPREWSEAFDGAPLEGAISGFAQAHAEINRALVGRVVELAETAGARVLELYAGSGNFTVALAPGAASYIAVEQVPEAARALRTNAAARALAVKVIEADAARALGRGAVDVVVLDPPRTGAPGVLAALAERKPKRIVYVSCDPATLARDLAEVAPERYALTWAEGFEMFPHTAELESVVRLERR